LPEFPVITTPDLLNPLRFRPGFLRHLL
jgi:hypothetical protein